MEKKLKVLLVDDSEPFRDLVRHLLEETSSGSILLESSSTLAEGLRRISGGGVDALLLDLLLPDSSGIDTLWKILAQYPDLPIVVLTGLDDEELALRAVKGGAQDFLSKEQLTGEIVLRALRHAVERKSLITRLQSSIAELERNNRDLEQFATAAARVLRSPVEMVSSTCRFLMENESGSLDEEARKRILDAQEGFENVRKLLEDFLSYIHVVVHKPPARERAECKAALDEALEKLKGEMERSGARFTHEALPVVPVEHSALVMLFENLVSNALKFQRDVPPQIHLGVQKEGDELIFSVRDNGRGMDPEFPDQIFDLFPRSSPGGERSSRGIGLAICKRIVTNHGGRIWVESRFGEGSVFYFTLPVVQDQ